MRGTKTTWGKSQGFPLADFSEIVAFSGPEARQSASLWPANYRVVQVNLDWTKLDPDPQDRQVSQKLCLQHTNGTLGNTFYSMCPPFAESFSLDKTWRTWMTWPHARICWWCSLCCQWRPRSWWRPGTWWWRRGGRWKSTGGSELGPQDSKWQEEDP